MATPGDNMQYRVLPMIGPDKNNLRPDADRASEWTEEIALSHEVTPNIQVYFNRGIVAAQWVSRRLGITAHNLQSKKLETAIETPSDPFRAYLAGPLGAELLALLASAEKENRHIYAALYELDDEELESTLEKFAKRAHVVLANGSVKKKGEDENSDARNTAQR